MTSAQRVSQRAPLACLPCTKRKMRCSKTLPCVNCVRRRIPGRCVREAVILSRTTVPDGHHPSTAIWHEDNSNEDSVGRDVGVGVGVGQDININSSAVLIAEGSATCDAESSSADRDYFSALQETTGAEISSINWDYARPESRVIATSRVGSVNWDYGSPHLTLPIEASHVSPSATLPIPVATRATSTVVGKGGESVNSPSTSSTIERNELAMEAANALESLAWGSHKATVEVYHGRNRALNIRGSLSNSQEKQVLEFHRVHVAWTHNVLHMPTFVRECQSHHHKQQSMPGIGWLSLYYAVLSLSFMYMPEARANVIGLPDTHLLAQSFYDLTIESLHTAELATINSIYFIQAICIILPCCHVFGDPKRIMILLSMANATAQIMNLHRMEPKPVEPASVTDIVSREIQKRVWCFLCIQDSYLITFKRSYSIVMLHCTTPPPANCEEEETIISCDGFVVELGLSQFTQNTYQLLQRQMTDVSRALFDSVSALERANHGLCEIFDKVLAADARIVRLAQDMPDWLKPQAVPYEPVLLPSNADNKKISMENLRRTLRMSLCHTRMLIHRSFFCRGMTDKRFHYSYSTCLDAARIILREYQFSVSRFEVDCWTIPAHVISACNIIMLKTVFNRLLIDVVGDEELHSVQDYSLMQTCLTMIRDLRHTNKIVERGLTMINRLMENRYDPLRTYTNLDADETTRLVREVEARIRADSGLGELDTMGLGASIFSVFDVRPSH